MNSKQLFFRADEEHDARWEAHFRKQALFAIVDKRSKNPRPRMFVLGRNTVNIMRRSPMWKRMWEARQEE